MTLQLENGLLSKMLIRNEGGGRNGSGCAGYEGGGNYGGCIRKRGK